MVIWYQAQESYLSHPNNQGKENFGPANRHWWTTRLITDSGIRMIVGPLPDFTGPPVIILVSLSLLRLDAYQKLQ